MTFITQDEMNDWIHKVNTASGVDVGPSHPTRSQTLPSAVDSKAEEPKKRGFFTLSKKK